MEYIANIKFNGEKLKAFPLRSETRKWCVFSPCSFLKKKKKLKIEPPYDPGIPSESEYYMKKMKTLIQKDNCTSKFTAASFTIAKI